jgi:hypothetical protein
LLLITVNNHHQSPNQAIASLPSTVAYVVSSKCWQQCSSWHSCNQWAAAPWLFSRLVVKRMTVVDVLFAAAACLCLVLGLRQAIREAEAKNAADAAAAAAEAAQLGTPSSNGTGAKADTSVAANAASRSESQ